MYTTRRRVARVMIHYYPNKNLFYKYSLNLPPLRIFLCRFNALLFAYLWILRFPSFLSFMKHSRTKILFSSSVYPLSFDGSAKNVYLLNFAGNRVTFIWLYIALTSFTCLRAKGGYKPQTIFTVVTTTSLTVLEMRGRGGEEQEVRGRSTQHPPQMILGEMLKTKQKTTLINVWIGKYRKYMTEARTIEAAAEMKIRTTVMPSWCIHDWMDSENNTRNAFNQTFSSWFYSWGGKEIGSCWLRDRSNERTHRKNTSSWL